MSSKHSSRHRSTSAFKSKSKRSSSPVSSSDASSSSSSADSSSPSPSPSPSSNKSRSRSRSRSRNRSKRDSHKKSQSFKKEKMHGNIATDINTNSNGNANITSTSTTTTTAEGKKRRKESETAEERRIRRLKKKKLKLEKQQKMENEKYFGYSNDNNPFNDSNLTQLFIWRKKYEEMGLSEADIRQKQKLLLLEKQAELHQEIMKTKERRHLREKEKETEELLKAQLAKEMELEQNADWQQKEEEFHQTNAIRRSQIRIKEQREEPIDVLVRNIHMFDFEQMEENLDESSGALQSIGNWNIGGVIAMKDRPLQDPVYTIDHLEPYKLHKLLEEIDMFLTLHKNAYHWKMAQTYCRHVLDNKLKEEETGNRDNWDKGRSNHHRNDNRNTLPNAMADRAIEQELESKPKHELSEIIEKCEKIVSGEANKADSELQDIALDVEYWGHVLQMAKVCLARQYLRDKFREYEYRRKAKNALSTSQQENKNSNDTNNNNGNTNNNNNSSSNNAAFPIPEILLLEKDYILEKDIPMIFPDDRSYKELYKQAVDAEEDWDIIEDLRSQVLKGTMEKSQKQLEMARHQNKHKSQLSLDTTKNETNNNNPLPQTNKEIEEGEKNENITTEEDAGWRGNPEIVPNNETMYETERNRGMENGENAYNNSEVTLPEELKTTYWWHDKYRPRKPRYFNRVKTGYSWNKYNQTHYDPDNPPPKIVQGYKFNIFYPDLIDPTKPPTFKVYEVPGSEYATIVFHAGPPYEDIAFKIVNNEWEADHQRGYRCRFEKGIFSLYFNFQRYRYRR